LFLPLSVDSDLFEDAIYADEAHGQSIQLHLTTNNAITPYRDSPAEHFNSALTRMRQSKSSTDSASTKSILGAVHGEVKQLLGTHKDVIKDFLPLHEITDFTQQSLLPKDLIKSKEVTYGVRFPIQLIVMLISERIPSSYSRS
jgi:hypothetical protein